MDIYKHKYLKYKQKISQLKHIGGATLFPILVQFDKDRFEGWYNMKTVSEHKNAFEIFLDLQLEHLSDLNILVGASSAHDLDYYRFNNSSFYSLYIDNVVDVQKEASKQYYMYTIDYDTLGDFSRFPENSVNQIHFDTGVAYFAPINYLEFAQRVLKPGGKIFWDLVQHGGSVVFRRQEKFYKSSGVQYTDEEITHLFEMEHIFVDTVNKVINPTAGFFDANNLAPQMRISIVEFNGNGHVRYTMEPYNEFSEYCTQRFRNLTFEIQYYTFANYTYPVPIRVYDETGNIKINVHNSMVNFVVNNVMNIEERTNYIATKTVTIEKIIQLCDRINITEDLKIQILSENLIKQDVLDLCKISDNPVKYNLELILVNYIWQIFLTKMDYVVATKNQ